MEDDDEFGDLYTDVLQAFPSSSYSPPQQHQSSPPKPPSLHRSIDLNLQIEVEDISLGAPHNFNSTISQPSTDQTIVSDHVELVPEPIITGIGNSGWNSIAADSLNDREVGRDKDLAGELKNSKSEQTELGESKVLEKDDLKLRHESSKDLKYGDKSGDGGVGDEEGGGKGVLLEKSGDFDDEVHNDVKFDVKEDQDNVGNVGSDESLIPGLSRGGPSLIPGVSDRGNALMKEEPIGEGDDWDSDSEDDLQIVLNDDNHGPMAMDGGGLVGSDDEDGSPLVIVADGNDSNHQAMEEQKWGEDGTQAADGERKEMGDGVKGNGGMAVVPKMGYSNHGFHPFNSQFKYVRPGTTPMAGVATMGPGGAPGQVRPLIGMGLIAGRGRGDWRPPGIKNGPMQKGIRPGFGMPAWGNGPLGRGFGGGLEFTLPSHKTIFEVDIDSFEEKPWKYPGVDVTDFFNFGLNEESWKDHCKQLEQLRLESTMQSKIRVYESGRTEQDYDPDMPPELAAATGINDVSAENANLGKTDAGQSNLTNGSARVRPPMPTGRAIQVEGGYGERLPSIDTRPPRIRDSDAIIEIVLRDSLEDGSSTGNGILEPSDNNSPKEDLIVEVDRALVDTEYADDNPHTYNGRKKELVRRRLPCKNSVNDDDAAEDGNLPSPQSASVHLDSRGQSPVYPSTSYVSPNEQRRRQGRQRDRSPQMTVSQSSRDKFLDNRKEESLESMDGKHSAPLSSPATVGGADEPSFEQIDAVDNEPFVADGSSEMEADEMHPNTMTITANSPYSKKKQKVSSRVEHQKIQKVDDVDDLKAARSSESSKARSGSSRDFQKLRDSVEDEVIQDRSSTRMENIKRHLDDDEKSFRRRDCDGRPDMESKRVVVKGREDSYPYRDWDPNSSHPSLMKTERSDRRKERESSNGVWQQRDEDPHGRRIRTEDSRKRDFRDEMGPRRWGKIRDSGRSEDEQLHLRKQLDNGSWRGHHKDAESRHRERDDTLKGRHENMDDYYSKSWKDKEHLRKGHANKEEILLGHGEITGRRKREKDDILDQWRRDGQPRIRDNLDDHHSVRQKDEGWLQRKRSEKQRDERHSFKQSLEDSLSKREREDGRAVVRSGWGAEDKLWVSNSRANNEYKGSDKDYQIKDTGRHSEQVKRRDRIEDESLSHHRGREDVYPQGNQICNEERRSRQERLSTRNDRAPIVSDNQRVHDKNTKENTRKNRDSDGFDYSTSGISKRNQEYHSGHRNDTVSMKGTTRQENGVQEISVHPQSSRKHRENAPSDDELQDSRRGRLKTERRTSHKERDFSSNSKSSSSLRVKEIDRNNNGGSSLGSKLPDDSSKSHEAVDNQPLVEEKDAGDLNIKDAGSKPVEDRHLDTVAKLKKRSERFKLPMPSEKEVMTTKKVESEASPIVECEVTVANTEIKQERPARKRRWINN